MLEMKHITKRFPGVVALSDISLSLGNGEVHALVGENGAGKSTLMKVLNGVYQADEGQIFIDGKPERPRNTREAQRLGISIIFQEFSLVPYLNAYENIFLGRELLTGLGTVRYSAMRGKARAALEAMNVLLPLDKPVAELTVAEQQFVEIAKATIFECSYLVLDEPTATLTPLEVKKLFEVIRRLQSRGVGCFYISHHLEEIYEIADTVSVLRDGRHVFTGPIGACSQNELISRMVGREVTQAFPPKRPAETMSKEIILDVRALKFEESEMLAFQVRKGEILGIAGLVGAKRSESFLALIGRNHATHKEVYLNGKPCGISSPAAALKQGIGYLPEDRKKSGLFLPFSIRANIVISKLDTLKGMFGFVSARKESDLSAYYVERMRIRTTTDRKMISELSGGNQQKAIIARWLATKCQVLIFDEPTRGIDVGAKAEIYLMLQELAGEGLGIVVISSDLPEVVGIADRVLVMRYGSIRAELAGDDINSEKIMYYAAGGE
ncbi:MAG: sugar ABC transporter ATP-binding protein [Candidatus Accumulibacter sp.]|jgi:ribose transport system ATP-binding protein|nr:sugar ABC transporter ATP-binding protein [Accumulibacter sp.]